MGDLLSYSGLVTKIRAMKSQLLTEEQYQRLLESSSVPMAVAYLKQKDSYTHIWDSLGEEGLHRNRIEKLLTNSIYNDFASIYRFANMEQRKFLSLYFKRYEVSLIKTCLARVLDHRTTKLDLSIFESFFQKHSKLNLQLLTSASSMEEFVSHLKGSEYYLPMDQIQQLPNTSLFDFETALDLYYFSSMWKAKDMCFSKESRKGLEKVLGTKFDMLNISWIQRARTIYHPNPSDIYTMLIPIHYKLREREIEVMIEAETDASFQDILGATYYARRYPQLSADNLEDMYIYILKNVLKQEAKKNPYSLLSLYQYLYLKDHEIQRLTVALECIRYQLPPDQAIRLVFHF